MFLSHVWVVFLPIGFLATVVFVFLKEFHFNVVLKISISLAVASAIIQTVLTWLLVFGFKGKMLPSELILASSIIGLVYRASPLRRSFRFKIHYLHILFFVFIFSLLSFYVFGYSNFGDMGWDSNAYHLPLINELFLNSARGWDESIGTGYYTFFVPFGAHAMGMLGYALSGNVISVLSINVFAATNLSFLVLGILKHFGVRVIYQLLATLAVVLIPSVIGQTAKMYIDLYVSMMYLSSLILLYLFVNELQKVKNFGGNGIRVLFVFLAILFGSTLQTKTHQFLQLAPLILFFILYVCRFFKYRSFRMYIFFFFAILVCSASPSYLRNLFEFGNPFYPIKISYFQIGTISVREFGPMFDNFIPDLPVLGFKWFSAITLWPLIGNLIAILSSIGLRYDGSRFDLSSYSYDTTSGGIGVFFAILILGFIPICSFFAIRKLQVKRLSSILSVKNDKWINPVFMVLILLSIVLTPGGWWPRYSLGPLVAFGITCLILLSKLMVRSFNFWIVKLAFLLSVSISLVGTLGYYNYEKSAFERQVYESKWGLNQNIPIKFLTDCENLYVVEPRPTFTSISFISGCNHLTHVGFNINLAKRFEEFDSQDWILINSKLLDCENPYECKGKIANYLNSDMNSLRYSVISAWFDRKFQDSSVLVGKNNAS